MSIYYVNILSVCLSVILQKDVFILVLYLLKEKNNLFHKFGIDDLQDASQSVRQPSFIVFSIYLLSPLQTKLWVFISLREGLKVLIINRPPPRYGCFHPCFVSLLSITFLYYHHELQSVCISVLQ